MQRADMSNPSVLKMVEAYLRQNSYAGLYNARLECGCFLDDLMPCQYPDEVECVAGYRVRIDDGRWGVGPEAEEEVGKDGTSEQVPLV